jgi:hypothetical protein
MPSQNKESAEKSKPRRNLLLYYSGMAAQFLVVIGLMVLAGLKADQYLGVLFPIFIWLLPLLTIAGLIIKAVRDTSNK